MKRITFFLLVILTSYKSETKNDLASENEIDQTVYTMWDNFTESNPEFEKDELPETDFFDNKEIKAHRYADLIVNGKKKASSGLYIWYKEANIDLPKIGVKLIVTDYHGKAHAIIETKKVDTIPFDQITKEYAELDMGTTIQPLEKWKKAHWNFFANALEQNGQETTDEMLVV